VLRIIINYGLGPGPSNGKSRIADPDPDPGNHPSTDSDLDPTFELQFVEKEIKIWQNLSKSVILWT